MDLSIIIVSWNVKEKLRENLRSIFNSASSLNMEVFVVDNNSFDNSAEMVEKEFSQVSLIKNKKNFGFAKANNQAIQKARGDFILLLNPDMRVFSDTLINILKWMRENKQASVAGCHLIDELGNTIKHIRKFPRLSDQFAITLKLPHLFAGVLNDYLRVDFNYGVAQKVDSIRGGFFMLRRNTIEKIGLLDEQFFLWFEEVDYCRRVKVGGGQVWYTPAAKCVDYVGQSFSQVKRGTTQKYFRDSMLKYFKKWHPSWQYYILKTAWPFGMLTAIIADFFKLKNRART